MGKTQGKSSIISSRGFRLTAVALAILIAGIIIGASGASGAKTASHCEPAAAPTIATAVIDRG